MKTAFVAGKFIANTTWEIEQNVRKAEAVAAELWKMGIAALCPHTNSRFFFGLADESVFLEGYRRFIRSCDAVFLVDGWETSKGTAGEIQVALSLDIPVFEFSSKSRVCLLLSTDDPNWNRTVNDGVSWATTLSPTLGEEFNVVVSRTTRDYEEWLKT